MVSSALSSSATVCKLGGTLSCESSAVNVLFSRALSSRTLAGLAPFTSCFLRTNSRRNPLQSCRNSRSTRNRSPSVLVRAGPEEGVEQTEKAPFGYTRKDVILIGVGILALGVLIKTGLEAVGLDSAQAGNVVQITLVLGLMLAWTATYVFRVGNKEMTYVKQLKDYEDAVMQKRLEELPEAELEAMLAEIEEEKLRIKERRERKKAQGK